MNPSCSDDFDYSTRPDLAVATLIHLLARSADVRRPHVAFSILAHLHAVGRDTRLPPAVRRAAAEAYDVWQRRLDTVHPGGAQTKN